MQRSFNNKAVAINEISPKKVTLDEAIIAFKTGFEEGLNINLEPYQLTDEELKVVMDIAKSRYESDEWNFMR